MQNFLQVNAINKNYGQRSILKNISFTVPAGGSLAIIGQSGSGKSTLLNIIGLLEKADSGHVVLAGKQHPPVNSRQAMLLRRSSINYLFQSFALVPSMTVKENILLAMRYLSASKAEKMAQIEQMLEKLSVRHLIDQKVATLSGGEQQRVALARCLLKPGDLILADEPTGSLDKKLAAASITEMLQLHREYGKTLIIVTHDPEVAQRCDRIFDLNDHQ